MLIERRDLRVLPDGWYWLEVKKVEEVLSGYGPAVQFHLEVFEGRGIGSRVVLQTDRVATRGNKLGRLLGALASGWCADGFVDSGRLVGGRFQGRVVRYTSGGRVRVKVVEFKSLVKGGATDEV